MPRLSMCGAVHRLPHVPSFRAVWLTAGATVLYLFLLLHYYSSSGHVIGPLPLYVEEKKNIVGSSATPSIVVSVTH
jgi:hypothetical protein